LNTVGGEPNWIRLQISAGQRSEPNLLSPVTAGNNQSNTPSGSEPLVLRVEKTVDETN
jgi:hypothetical protein